MKTYGIYHKLVSKIMFFFEKQKVLHKRLVTREGAGWVLQ